MAYQKTLTLPSGVSGNYLRLVSFSWDRNVREATAYFALFVDHAAAENGKAALTPWVAKLRLEGAIFDQYLGNAALVGDDILGQLYVAAREQPVISDFGDDLFVSAISV